MMRTSNPALNDNTFSNLRPAESVSPMTIQGTVNNTITSLALLMLSAYWSWQNPGMILPLLLPAVIVGLIVALVTIFKKEWSPFTTPIYALAQGLILGGVSLITEKAYPGIVVQAVGLTFGTLFALLMTYKFGFVRVTDGFRLGVFAATGGIALFYFASMILSLFHIQVPMINGGGPIGIGFSAIVVIVAALNLVLDFDFIERGAQHGAPKFMEWYGAFSLMITLIWLYMEILRLLSKMRNR